MAKFTMYLKDPDGACQSIQSAADGALDDDGIPGNARARLRRNFESELSDFADQWLLHGEVAVIEFDTVAGTATLKRARS